MTIGLVDEDVRSLLCRISNYLTTDAVASSPVATGACRRHRCWCYSRFYDIPCLSLPLNQCFSYEPDIIFMTLANAGTTEAA